MTEHYARLNIRKNILFLFTFLSIGFFATAQNPYMIISEYPDGTAWTNSMRSLFTYNTAGNTTEELAQYWDLVSGTWVDDTRITYTYGTDGLESMQTYEYWDGSAWTWTSKTVRTYTTFGKISVTESSNWNAGAWQPSSKSEYSYDASNMLEQQLNSQYSQSSSTWNPLSNHLYTNNTDGTIATHISQHLNNGSWENDFKYTHSYTATGKISSISREGWNAASWQPYQLQLWTYDASDFMTRNEYQSYSQQTGLWTPDIKADYTNLPSGQIDITLQSNWINSAWQPSQRFTHYYTGLALEPVRGTGAVAVFPNPAVKTLHVINSNNTAVDVVGITDLTGKRMECAVTGETIDISNLQSGMYILHLSSGGKDQFSKFLKN